MLEIKNIRVYDLEESIVTRGFPMSTGELAENFEYEVDNLKYWSNTKEFKDILDRMSYVPEKSNKTDVVFHRKTLNEIKLCHKNKCAKIIIRDNQGVKINEALIDCEDMPKIDIRFGISSVGYAYNSSNTLELGKFILNTDKLVDHINRNKLDCRKINLRVATPQQNTSNKSLLESNTSGVTGVNYRKDRSKWRAFIMVDAKHISLGMYEHKEDAIKARLLGELKYFKEFSPQMGLLEKYEIDNPYKNYSKNTYNLYSAVKHFISALNLFKSPAGSGHDCALKGIRVSFNLKFPEYISPQLQRYNWFDIVSSESKMHRLTKMDIKESCNKYVDDVVIKNLDRWIDVFNRFSEIQIDDMVGVDGIRYTKYGVFMKIISNCPMGLEKWMGISTNYMQLKTIFNQRETHKLKEDYSVLCEFIKDLPYAKELIWGSRK